MRRAVAIVIPMVGALLMALGAASGAGAASIHVTRTGDPTPNGCHPHDCSLREAVIKANGTGAADTVLLKAKTYKLSIEGSDEDLAQTGDLDVLNPLKIVGAGASKTTIEGAWSGTPDRLFQVPGSTSLSVSTLTLKHGNAASEEGGAILGDVGATIKLTKAHLVSNRADYTGAVASYGRAAISKTMFRTNHATSCCGALYIDAGTGKLTNVAFDRNTAVADTGAMYVDGDRVTLKNITFSRNVSATYVGGGIIISNGIANLTNVTFSGNKAADSGGALRTESGSTSNLNNVTFTKNVADSDNSGSGDGGGIEAAGGTLSIQNTILAKNVDRGGEARECVQDGGTIASGGHNLVGSLAGCGYTLASSDLTGIAHSGLEPLADNGGFTKTVALKKRSKAVDKGSGKRPGSGEGACAKRDQRGVKRPRGPRCDIGAYERKR